MDSMKWLCSMTFVLLFSLASHAQQVNGVMMVVKGDIKVTGKDGKTEAAKVGKKVIEGDSIVAGADSRAKIVMADKNVINVSPDSKIVIEKYQNDGKDQKNVELNVLYGKVRASVEQKYDGEKSKFNVKTPSAVAGVRGTDFLTGYNPTTKASQIITFAGSVAVGQPGPGGTIRNPVFVNPGQMTSVGSGQAPEPPKALPKEELNRVNTDTAATQTGEKSGDKNDKSADKSAKNENGKKDGNREPSSDKNSMIGKGDMTGNPESARTPDSITPTTSGGGSPQPTVPPPTIPTMTTLPVPPTLPPAFNGTGRAKTTIIIAPQ